MALVALVAIVAKYTAAAQLGGLGAARPSLLEALRVAEAGRAKRRGAPGPVLRVPSAARAAWTLQ